MMGDKDLRYLLQKSLEDYNNLKEEAYVVSPSLPILYFGDLNAYLKSDFKVITAGLNPSDLEFKQNKTDNPNFFRFPEFNHSIESLHLALNNYFNVKPYEKWFGKKYISKSGFLPVLNGLDTCYYINSKKNTALHTDFCSPLATNPTWSGLNKNQQDLLSLKGFEMWKELVLEIKPDLILISIKKDYLNQLPIRFIRTIESKFSRSKRIEYQLNHYKLRFGDFSTNLVWGSAQNTPLQPFKDKYQLGIKIKKYLSCTN